MLEVAKVGMLILFLILEENVSYIFNVLLGCFCWEAWLGPITPSCPGAEILEVFIVKNVKDIE